MNQTSNSLAALDPIGLQGLHLADPSIMPRMPSDDALALHRVIARCAADMTQRWPTPPVDYPMRQR